MRANESLAGDEKVFLPYGDPAKKLKMKNRKATMKDEVFKTLSRDVVLKQEGEIMDPVESSSSRQGRKGSNSAQKKFFVGAAIIVCSIGYLIYTGVKASGSYYYKVSEVAAMGPKAMNMNLRLEGKVQPGSIQRDATNLKLNFHIIDQSNKTMPVYYEGVAPDMFKDNIDVVVEGKLDNSGKLLATRLLTSCPSKYEAAGEVKKSL